MACQRLSRGFCGCSGITYGVTRHERSETTPGQWARFGCRRSMPRLEESCQAHNDKDMPY